jgi:hypothetical protein
MIGGAADMAGVVRKEVLNALEAAEARGEKRVRVIVGLRDPESMQPIKAALARLRVRAVLRETEGFLVARLNREELEQVSQLTQHVRAVWLDQPVSAA